MSDKQYLTRINLAELAEIKRTGSDTVETTNDPAYYYINGRTIGFIGQDGGALSEGCTITLWYSRTPLSDGTESLTDAILPIIDKRWDTAMVLGACYELTGDVQWLNQFWNAINKLKSIENAQTGNVQTIPVNREED